MPDSDAIGQVCLCNSDQAKQIELLREKLQKNTLTIEALQDSEKRYRRLFESAKDGILILDALSGKIVDVNPFLLRLLGYEYNALCGRHIWEIGAFKDIAASKDAFKELQDNEYIRYEDLPLETLYGRPVDVEFVSNVYLVDQSKVIQCNIRDITARKWAESERKRLLTAIDQVGEAIFMTDTRGIIEFVNPAFENMTGYSQKEAVGQNPSFLRSGKQDEHFYHDLWDTISSGKTWTGLIVNKRKDGTHYSGETTISPVRDDSQRIINYVAVQRDISEQLRLAAQVQESQKMEALGLLAGGVAHDYNNMLSVIIGFAELGLSSVETESPIDGYLRQILKAANRSTEITRQLLALARKQVVKPLVLNLNQAVASLLNMLRRLIGENIDLAFEPKADLFPVRMDPSQFDQILINLCVNARDAIAGIGKITIAIDNTVLDDSHFADHKGSVTGDYVLLTVSDDGCGMSKETIARIFEPFFTSKVVGQGTGLGLSTVYGIVKQNDGFIDVFSEPEKGTTFRIYLPRAAVKVADTLLEKTKNIPLGHGEMILVVEDEPSLLTMGKMILERLGYRVLAAGTPEEATQLIKRHAKKIQLLITDIVMPEMNGRDLARRLQPLCPNMKILFMSGYTADVIAHHGVLEDGVKFIQKPFLMNDIATKVWEVLSEK